jgi:glycosyltransferase involved in cell wall biosynthesis
VREQARFICLVHDLIPIQFPEYARETGASLHRVRMDTVGHHASAVIAYSHATADALRAYLDDHCSAPPIRIAPLGANTRSVLPAEQLKDHPYFVFLGTIEPRKNHLLLLNVWRRLVEETKDGNAPIPKLVLIGRRGWENENIVDMLDRCPALKDHVIEASRLSDPDAQDLMRQACALVLPSFVEGFGLPIAEALEMGVPVLCSDIPAHREVGGAVPEFIDPLDGPGWLRAIRDYAAPGSWRRRAQVKRMAEWSRPSWDDHIKAVIETCDLVATKG